MPRIAARSAALSSAVLAFLALGAGAQELRWRSGEVLERPVLRGRGARGALLRRLAEGTERHLLVRFERSPSAHERVLWRAAGLELGRALGGGAWFARVAPAAFDPAAAARLAAPVDVRELQLAWKLEPTLAAGDTAPWTVVARDERGAPTVAVYVLLHEGVALARGDALLASLGGSTFDLLESVNGIVAFVPRARVAELAAADEVAWVEPALPRLEGTALTAAARAAPNDSSRALVQADLLQAAPYGLDGSGVDVLLYDTGAARATHADFGGRLFVRDGSGLSDHSTHVAGTLGGSGSASGGAYRGMAPGVTLESYGFHHDFSGILFFTNPGDLESDYEEALGVLGVDIANNSLASNTETNGFPCPIQGDYGVTCSLIDGIVHGSLGAPFRIVWADGNERQGTRCDIEGFGGYYSTAPPATAKNHITVGAVNSDDDSMTFFSSWGPTDDGRLKPDVSAPGCQTSDDFGVTSASASSDTAYAVACGTSMAAPAVCGVAALLIEDWRAQFGGADPLNSTLKVLLAHTAVDRGNAGPDYQFGFGSVRAKDAVDFMRLGQFVEDELEETGAHRRWSVTVAPATSELRLTLAWDDAPAMPNMFGVLVNDLDLVVRDPLGAQHHVWTLDPAAPGAAAVRTGADHRNNLEQVLVAAPAAGTWTVEVRAFDVPAGPQSFSLASSHPLVAPPHLSFSFPDDLPAVLAPGVTTPVTVRVSGVNDDLVGDSPALHVSYAGGPFLELPMSALGGDLYQAELPPAVCAAAPQFWFSAEGVACGPASSPEDAPTEVYLAFVTTLTTVFADDFSTDLGWSVTNEALIDGPWERATPSTGGKRGDPLTAFGGAGQCYVTEDAPGNSDVDGGPTRLVSPLLDLSEGDGFEVSYERWFTNTTNDADALTVQLSNDGGATWTAVESVSGGGGGWRRHSFRVEDFVAPTGQVRVRFDVSDTPDNSVVEAGLDDFVVVRRACASHRDCDGNGILDSDDVAHGRALDVNSNGVPDECEPPRADPLGKVRSNPTRPGPP